MSVRFAGSRRVDERRRRNLATQSEPKAIFRRSSRSSSGQNQQEESVSQSSSASYFPVKKIVSRRKWKLSLVALGLVAVSALFLYLSVQIQKSSENWPADLVRFFSLEDGLLYRSLNSLFVFLSAQLTLGIWWARSRSLHDFSGQYRTWFTVAMIGFMVSFCMATDAHLVFSNTVAWYWQVDFWKQELLGWAVPLLGCATAAVCSMHIELRKNRLSLFLFWFAMLIWGSSLAFSFDAGQEVLAEQFTLAKTATLSAGSIFLFLSLLYHTQFVLYIDADPPIARVSLRKRILGRLRFRKAKKEEAGETKEKTEAKSTTEKKPAQKKTIKPAKAVTPRAKPAAKTKSVSKTEVKKETKPVKTQKKQPQKKTTEKITEKKPVAKKATEEKPKSFNIEDYYFEPGEPLDQELLKGLSKRERRQLRKQWKQSQRAA